MDALETRVRGVSGIVFGGAVLAFLLSPLAKRLERKFPRGIAAGLSLALTAAALAILISLAFPALARQLSTLMDLLPETVDRLRLLLNSWLEHLQRRAPELRLPRLSFTGMDAALGEFARRAASWLGSCSPR